MKLFSSLLILLILVSAFSRPPALYMKMTTADNCVVKHKLSKSAPCCPKSNNKNNNNKMHPNGSFCYYCVLCIAFIIPAKPGLRRDFVLTAEDYSDRQKADNRINLTPAV